MVVAETRAYVSMCVELRECNNNLKWNVIVSIQGENFSKIIDTFVGKEKEEARELYNNLVTYYKL